MIISIDYIVLRLCEILNKWNWSCQTFDKSKGYEEVAELLKWCIDANEAGERLQWLNACASNLRNMLKGPGLTSATVSKFTTRYKKKEIDCFLRGDFGDHDPLEVLTHMAVVISENLTSQRETK